MRDNAERQQFIDAQPDVAEISMSLPLRANLSVLENIAIVPQYRQNMPYTQAADQAWGLLTLVGHTDCAFKRDPELSHEERFLGKLLRAIVLEPDAILIDRPAFLLPDLHYPPFLEAILSKLEDHFKHCWIVDYAWNEPLYAPR